MFGLENNGFLISLAISLLIAVVTMLYFRQQLSTLDHKVNSMFSLMTSLTQELNSLSSLNMAQQLIKQDSLGEVNDIEDDEEQDGSGDNRRILLNSDSRINVSSDSEDDESDSDSDSNDYASEYDSENSLIDLSGENDISTLNMGSELHASEGTSVKIIEISGDDTKEEVGDDSSFDSDDDDTTLLKSLVTELIEQTIELESNHHITDDNDELELLDLPIETLHTELTSDDVSIESITSLVEEEEEEVLIKSIEVPIDYSKVSVKALRDMVSSQNLANNVTKLKKQELINLLSV